MHADASGRIILVAVGILAILLAAAAGPVHGEVGAAERMIEANETGPGESVNVTVEVRVAAAGDRMSVQETFGTPFEAVELTNLTYNGKPETPAISLSEADRGVIVGIDPSGGFEAGDIVTVVYEVTVPANATDNATYRISGESVMDDGSGVEHAGDDTINVSGSPSVTPTPTASQFPEETPTPTPTGPESDADGAAPGLRIPMLALLAVGLYLRRQNGS